MPWWTWAALVFFALVVAAGTVVAVMSLAQMRRLGATGNQVADALDDLNGKVAELEQRLEHAQERAEIVERRIAKLNASLEALSVLTWAVGDVTKKVAEVRSALTLLK
jgi:hypothetical protein